MSLGGTEIFNDIIIMVYGGEYLLDTTQDFYSNMSRLALQSLNGRAIFIIQPGAKFEV